MYLLDDFFSPSLEVFTFLCLMMLLGFFNDGGRLRFSSPAFNRVKLLFVVERRTAEGFGAAAGVCLSVCIDGPLMARNCEMP